MVRNYLTNADLIEEIRLSKQRHRESNVELTPAECLTPRLTLCLMMLVQKYASKRNWSGYTYIDDMRSDAILILCQKAFKFDETRFSNPFAYYTTIITNSFLSFIEREKKQRDVRDDLLEAASLMPSFQRQMRNQEEQRLPEE